MTEAPTIEAENTLTSALTAGYARIGGQIVYGNWIGGFFVGPYFSTGGYGIFLRERRENERAPVIPAYQAYRPDGDYVASYDIPMALHVDCGHILFRTPSIAASIVLRFFETYPAPRESLHVHSTFTEEQRAWLYARHAEAHQRGDSYPVLSVH